MILRTETVVHLHAKLKQDSTAMAKLQSLSVFLFRHLTIVGMASLNLKKNVMITIRIQMTDVVLNVSLRQVSIVIKMEFVQPNVETASLLVLKFVIQENIDLVLLIV